MWLHLFRICINYMFLSPHLVIYIPFSQIKSFQSNKIVSRESVCVKNLHIYSIKVPLQYFYTCIPCRFEISNAQSVSAHSKHKNYKNCTKNEYNKALPWFIQYLHKLVFYELFMKWIWCALDASKYKFFKLQKKMVGTTILNLHHYIHLIHGFSLF